MAVKRSSSRFTTCLWERHLTDGVNTFTASSGNQTVDVTSWTLSSLTVTPPADSDQDFTLTVIATATETANADQQLEDRHDQRRGYGRGRPADVDRTGHDHGRRRHATALPFTISSALTDTDGSETLQLEISDVPVGATLTDGTQTFVASTGNTTVDVTSWSLAEPDRYSSAAQRSRLYVVGHRDGDGSGQ